MPTPDGDPEAAAGISTSVEQVDDVTILYVGGEIDLANCDFFRSTLEPCIASGAILVVDVADLDFIDSSGLKILVWASRTTTDVGGAFTLRHPSQAVRVALETCGLDFLVASSSTQEPDTAAFPDVIASLRAQAHGPVAES
jgi:anti-sigma B factor antagonist